MDANKVRAIIEGQTPKNGAADTLSRRDQPSEKGALQEKTPLVLLKPELFVNELTTSNLEQENNNILQSIKDNIQTDKYFGPIIKKIIKTTNHDGVYSFKNNILFYNGSICVPNISKTKRLILQKFHNNPAAGHFGSAKTFDQIAQNYIWPDLCKYVKDYVKGCNTCLRNKNSYHRPYGRLQPLPIPFSPWTSISIDFITQLPPSGTYSAICVFVDRRTKMALFIPTTNDIDAEGTAKLFINNVFSSFGLPSDVISDRGVTFTSKFAQEILKCLKVKQKISTAFHPQTDGQTERVNSVLEQYLRCYINYQQSDWSDLLPIVQFVYNSAVHSSTGFSPFYAVFGYHPRLSVSLPSINKDQTPTEQRGQKIHDLHEEMKFNIASAQEKHELFYSRCAIRGPTYKVGDKVCFSSKNIKTQRPTKKLDHKRFGPFEIVEIVGSRAYKLNLPSTMRIHPVFHTNLLEPFQEDLIKNRIQKPFPRIIVQANQEYEVESIVDSRIFRKTLQYLIHWKGYSFMDRTWQSGPNLPNCKELIQKFHQEHPNRPKCGI